MAVIIILGATLLTQLSSAVLALQMFRIYGRNRVWLLLSLASAEGFAFNADHSLHIVSHPSSARPASVPEITALAMSGLLMIGLGAMYDLFRARMRAEEELRGEKRQLTMLVDRRVADLEAEVAERKRAEDTLRRDGERFSEIIATQHDIATADLELAAMMDLIVERTQKLTRASGAVLQWVEGRELVYRAASGRGAAFLGRRHGDGDSLSEECVRLGQTLRCDDAECDPRVNLEACRSMGARSTIVVPLYYDHAVVGVLQATSPELCAFNYVPLRRWMSIPSSLWPA